MGSHCCPYMETWVLSLSLLLTLIVAYAAVAAAEERSECTAVVTAAEQWLQQAGAPLSFLRFSPSGTVLAAQEIRPRTVVQAVPRALLFGWDVEVKGEGSVAEAEARDSLAELLLQELHAPSSQWSAFLALLQEQIPRYAVSPSGERSRNSVCANGWGTPALLWSDEELSLAQESLLVTSVPAWRQRLAEKFPGAEAADALWAYSVALARSFFIFDGGIRRLVLAPIASNLSLGLRARTTFAYNGAEQELRFWVDDLYYEGDEVAALYAPLTTLELVIFFGYHEQVNPVERVPLDLFLDVHDKHYEEKRTYLVTAGILEEEEYPLGRQLYADVTGMVSPEAMALLRMKHYVAEQHARPASSDPREKERRRRETQLAEHQIRDEEEKALYPNPLTSLHKQNELSAVQELASTLNSRLARHFTTDLAEDQALYSRPPPYGQELNKELLNAVAVRIVEKDILGKAHRRLSRRVQQLTSEALHGAKKSQERPRQRANLDAFKLQKSTLLD